MKNGSKYFRRVHYHVGRCLCSSTGRLDQRVCHCSVIFYISLRQEYTRNSINERHYAEITKNLLYEKDQEKKLRNETI